ncbi:MAG: hypothetical protein F9K32_11615 [Desulfobulbaceae bacterium]|nr:MAG: hypothetical protein F9K32_11615 [Desulfobulbaceae bacterium]
MQPADSVQVLKKIQVAISAGSRPGQADLTGSPVFLAFIHGVASDGLSPFESAIHGRCAGDRVEVSLKTAALHEYFGHIDHAIREALILPAALETVCLAMEIVAVTDAGDREIVKAAALALAHGGCGGSCGCGCS